MGKLKFTESVSFSYLDQNWSKVKDDYEGAFNPQIPGSTHPVGMSAPGTDMQQTGNGLVIQIAATHSGIITRNNGFYLPERMKKGAGTFTKDYQKPVLLHHEDHKDPVGRIIESSYMDTSGAIQDKYRGLEVKNSMGKTVGTINDTLIHDFVNDKMPFGQQVDVVRNILRDSLLDDEEYSGLGYIRLAANITDPNAVQKLLDGRYITGSVGASTDKAVCSICKADWTKGGPCEHTPGAVYDEAKCFIIAGNLEYDEYSFVNVPADRHSKVLQLDYNGNTAEIEMADDYKGRIYEVEIQFPQYDSDTKEEKGMAKKDAKAKKAEGNLDIKDAANADPTPNVEPEIEGAKDVADSAAEDGKVEDIKDADASVEDGSNEDGKESIEDFVSRTLDIEDALSDEDQEKLYNLLWDEAVACFEDGEFTLEQLGVEKLEDAKRSAEQRKTLAKSQFCGPNKCIPVPDCAHVTAARRLIGRYKGEESKESILNCVARKAKAMGCDKGKKKDDVKDDVKNKDGIQHARVMRIILAAFEEDLYSPDGEKALSPEDKKSLTDILKKLSGMVGKDSFQSALFDGDFAHEETALLDEIVSLEENLGDLRDRLDATKKEYHLLFGDMEELQDSLVNERVNTRKVKESRLKDLVALRDQKVEDADFTKLNDSELDSEINRVLEVVDIKKITDKLGDGTSRTPVGDVEDPTQIQDGTNEGKEVQVEDLQTYGDNFVVLKIQDGKLTAEPIIKGKKDGGLLPQDPNDTEGGSK